MSETSTATPTDFRSPAVAAFQAAREEEGAAVGGPAGAPVVLDFGDPEREYRRLTEGAALLDDTDHALVRVFGARPRRMLRGLLSNDLAPLAEGRAVYSFVLTAKGRPVAEVRALPGVGGRPSPSGEDGPEEGAETWLDVPAACLDDLLDHFGRFLPPIHARFAVGPEWTRLAMVGPRAVAALGRAGAGGSLPASAPLDVFAVSVADIPVVAVRREPLEGPGLDLYLPSERLADAWERLADATEAEGGGPAGRRAYEIFRVERGVPAFGADFDQDTLAPETGQEGRAISYTKGCYTGQEVVARIHYRGHVNRHLRGLAFPDQAAPPEPGRPLYRDGRPTGHVTTVVRSPRHGVIALGYVRREVEPGEAVSLEPEDPPRVRVVELPFTPAAPAAG